MDCSRAVDASDGRHQHHGRADRSQRRAQLRPLRRGAEADGQALFLDHLDLFARSRMMLVGYYSLMPNLEGDLPEVFAAIRKTGCQTALDTAGDGGGMQPLDRILPHVDVYVPSHNEATHQTGHEDPRKIIDAYRSCGAAGLLGVKLGSQGRAAEPGGRPVRVDRVRAAAGSGGRHDRGRR